MNEDEDNKKTFKIGYVSKLLELNSSVLRFWENEFEELAPLRTETGQRLYSKKDIAIAKKIKDLLHTKGMTIEGAKKIFKKTPLPKGNKNILAPHSKVTAIKNPASISEKTQEIVKQNNNEVNNNMTLTSTASTNNTQSLLKKIEKELMCIKENLEKDNFKIIKSNN